MHAGLMQACDGVLADLAQHHRLLSKKTIALKGTEKAVLSCADWAELAGVYDLPRLSTICIQHFIERNRVSPERQIFKIRMMRYLKLSLSDFTFLVKYRSPYCHSIIRPAAWHEL